MAILRTLARVRARHLAAPATVGLLMAIVGCPTTLHSTTPISGVQAPPTDTTTPQPLATVVPVTPFTNPPVTTTTPSPGSGATVGPGFFSSPTPTPSPNPTPSLEPLDFQIDTAGGISAYAPTLFVVPAVGDLPHLDPPTSRHYSSFDDLGIGPDLASRSGVPQVSSVATASFPANWSITNVATLDVRPATAALPGSLADLIYFRLPDGSTASTAAATDGVEIEVATVSTGVLLTLQASVSAQVNTTFDGGATNSVIVPLMASNEGQVLFTVSDVRMPHPVRITP